MPHSFHYIKLLCGFFANVTDMNVETKIEVNMNTEQFDNFFTCGDFLNVFVPAAIA